MFKKTGKLEGVVFRSGTYHFKVPFFRSFAGVINVENGESYLEHAVVEMHVGRQEDLQEGKLATIFLGMESGNLPFCDFIQNIATGVVYTTFWEIFYRNSVKNFPFESIRWIERWEPGAVSVEPGGSIREAMLEWDSKEKQYVNLAQFRDVPQGAWYNSHRSQ